MKIFGLVIAVLGTIALGACDSTDRLLSGTTPATQEQFTPIQ